LQKPLQKPGLVSAESPLAARNAENGEWAVSEYDWPQKPLDGNWRSTRARTLQRDRYRCQRCNVRKPAVELDAHHVLPRAEGGRDTLWNLIALCEPCHDFVEVQDPPLRNRAQIVGSWVPVERDAAA
jgi:hypothetical protein